MKRRIVMLAMLVFAISTRLAAHETRPAYFEATEKTSDAVSISWKSPTLGDPPIELHPVLGEVVLENLPGECTQDNSPTGQSTLCRWELPQEPATSGLAGRRIAIDGLEASVTDALVRVNFADGSSVTRLLRPAELSWIIARGPRGSAVSAIGFFRMGVEHILYGIDHLLFVLLLLLIVEKRWALVKTVTAFTAAHTITLGMAVLGYVRVAAAPVEATIALSILFLASELAHHLQGKDGLTYRNPWIVAFSFGLLHGFGFAGTLANTGLPHADIPRALLFFNLGVEAGQLGFILAVLAAIRVVGTLKIPWPEWSEQVPAYAIGSVAAMWFLERCAPILR
jgi:hypothetical protein